ncbi:MAG: hypothetical protein AABW47_02615 [Nanoarchaeota archaeon]
MNKNIKMNAKKTLVSFLLIASVLFLASAVSAVPIVNAVGDYTSISVKVNGDSVADTANLPAVNAEDTLDVKVSFTYNGSNALDNAETDSIKVKVTLEGEKDDVTESTSTFDVEEGKNYVKTLSLKVPTDFEKKLTNGDFALTLEIGDSEVVLGDLHVQRSSYEVSIKSVMTSGAVEAGQLVPVEVALQNTGYNDLEDLYVTVKIPELNIEKRAYFRDLVNVAFDFSTDDNAENTVRGNINLDIPYTAKAGKYTLVVEAENDEATATPVKKEITISNSVSDIAMKSGNDLVLINPTNSLKVYKLVYNSNEVVVILPAASTKSVPIEPSTNGEAFDVSVYAGETLLSTVKFSGSQATAQVTSPVFVLTVILAIVFLVLLVALVVLITKKPQKTEEFGESYY